MMILWAVLGYLLGSVPFGVLISRAMGLGDLRKIGSGNIGATNVLRTGNKPAALATLLLDGGKGAMAVLLAWGFGGDIWVMQVAGVAAFAGHCFPVWLGFKGGKGVATFLGLMLALAWPVGLLCCATWALAAYLSRVSSVGALAASAGSLVWMVVTGRPELLVSGVVLAALVWWRHSANIARLRAGTEPKIGQK
ncbi:glycerol-3-phosphate 1-O-acyltransferase PlsY [Antarctobacter heliothermus]|uniref:Glycerol-3-phosphate acyltransferase n=1 Tax=Antarctobacter heliothermus TaxID=74033 RepID=A0A239BKV9_9RHOB|nr:glycerol-3-phosphate 1-O-acyltransferase PlsY [Antarctobacter heliothermus]SNS07683.1 acyl-phosphate glycerol-3-phosphate acyltransferase [Antarctobacter heliothermus]